MNNNNSVADNASRASRISLRELMLRAKQQQQPQPQLRLPVTLVPENIGLDADQKHAVAELVRQRYGVLIGAAGTGKTTTIKALVSRILSTCENAHIAFCAFTGRAVQQIKRALPPEFRSHADTIHGLLEYGPFQEERYNEKKKLWYTVTVMRPRRTAANPLDQNIIIVDEASMVPIALWNKLIAACRPGTRIYLIGDIQQLQPVHGKSVLGFAMLHWPTFELTRYHRTNESAIIDGAHAILSGRMPEVADKRIALVQLDNGSVTAYTQIIGLVQKLHQNGIFDPMRDCLIVPQNIGTIGQEHINEYLMNYFNPPSRENPRVDITAGSNHCHFAVGDKVMVIKNDRLQGLTNGMIGVITAIQPNGAFRGERIMAAGLTAIAEADFDISALDNALAQVRKTVEVSVLKDEEPESERQASHIVTVQFQNVDGTHTFSTAGAINTLRHAYAFTCHKAQGGEFHTVVIVCHSANMRMLSREWLYTAWTRAQARVILLYNQRGLRQALRRQLIVGNTLAEKAECYIKIQEKLSEAAAADNDVISCADDENGNGNGNGNGKNNKLPFLPEPVAEQ